jgi:pantetheine-phosphate adenylyltransferase
MEVAIGGTFDYLHKGHREMLREAFEIGDTIVGITSDEMANSSRDRKVSSYEKRKKRVEEYCETLGEDTGSDYRITKIDSPTDGGIFSEEIEYIVISPESKTVERVNEINKKRNEMGLDPLYIKVVDSIYAEDGGRISSTRISEGVIDRDGNLISEGRVTFINDIHYGFFDEEDKNEDILDSLDESLSSVDDCIVLGDLIHESEDRDTDLERFEEAWDIIESNTEDAYFVPGNHDVVNLYLEDIEGIVNHSLPLTVDMKGKTFHLINSAKSEYDGIGRVCEESMKKIHEVEEGYIVSHYPLVYTNGYQKSTFFGENPEGVFPINKWKLNLNTDGIFAHLHVGHSYKEGENEYDILPPFLNITNIEDKEAIITNNMRVY